MTLAILSSQSLATATESPLRTPNTQPSNRSQDENRLPARNHPYGGTLVWGTSNPPTIINPILTTHSVSASLLKIIFNRLIRRNTKGEIEPDLARKWEISEDGLRYTFYLKEGVKFHDGVELTAEDVVFTLNQFMDPRNKSPYCFIFDLVTSVEIINKYTFKISLSKPLEIFLYKLSERDILPKHIYEGELQDAYNNYHPIGSGPFKFKNWDKETNTIALDYNPDYFEGRPYLDRIIVKTFSDNSQLWSAFMRQEVDLVKYIKREDFALLEKDLAFKTYKIPWESHYVIVYNLRDSVLSDIEVRRAIARGIDKNEIMKVVSGEGLESLGPFHPASIGFNPHVKPLEYNPIKAKMELNHRGWREIDGDGILEKGTKKLEITLLVDNKNNNHKKIASIIRQQLSMLGIKIKVLLYDDEGDLTSDYLEKHKVQAWLRLILGIGPGLEGYEAAMYWYSSSNDFGKLWNFKNLEVDRLFKLAIGTQDINTRRKFFQQIHKVVYENQPACFLFYPMSFHAISSKFQNTDAYFTPRMPTYTLKDWYILK